MEGKGNSERGREQGKGGDREGRVDGKRFVRVKGKGMEKRGRGTYLIQKPPTSLRIPSPVQEQTVPVDACALSSHRAATPTQKTRGHTRKNFLRRERRDVKSSATHEVNTKTSELTIASRNKSNVRGEKENINAHLTTPKSAFSSPQQSLQPESRHPNRIVRGTFREARLPGNSRKM